MKTYIRVITQYNNSNLESHANTVIENESPAKLKSIVAVKHKDATTLIMVFVK